MKKLIYLMFIIVLSVSISSCKKKYSGCCKYTTTLASNNQALITNYCVSDDSKESIDNHNKQYQDLVTGQYNSIGMPWEYTITGEGCNFSKSK